MEDMCLRPTHGWTMDLAQLLECFALLSLYKYAKCVTQIQIHLHANTITNRWTGVHRIYIHTQDGAVTTATGGWLCDGTSSTLNQMDVKLVLWRRFI